MSFSVRAGNSPSSQRSSASQAYVSPKMLPQAVVRLNVPSFSLPTTEDSLNNGSLSFSTKKLGTNPTRYKTTMCRNWEAGNCNFKGCTFAHGVEELRAPMRVDRYGSPNPHSHAPTQGKTPPQYSSALSGPLASPRIEQLLEMLYAEVIRDRDLVTVHVEANRTLESLLKKEQALHEETRAQLEAERAKANELTRVVLQTSEALSLFLDSCTVNEKQRGRIAVLLDKLAVVVPEGDDARDKQEGEENRVEELLRALQQCQKSVDA
ncbi:zinc finger-domain protein [Trypanosoma conorhini]|uniref:Zinc finger-domain protein n=1 Tax=Trypanosoma conorhini TaxID=83891 RepID=A0A3R7KEV1_9TRYP|nr:zinc finger-domain protein [Trypanosoma conorhini]RNF06528.1 zinc finger-domain protein [Trypanosoma conorhini]